MDNCKLCEEPLSFRWTDTHGVAVCSNCGLPYTVYHYDDDKQRIEKPPSVAIKESWIPIGKQYWEEYHRMVFPASYDFMLASRDSSYSGATTGDVQQFDEWLDEHESELPTD